MAAYNKFQDFVEQLCLGKHLLGAADHVCKVYLTTNTPDAAADAVKVDLVESVTGTGYTAGGTDVQNAVTETSGTASVTGVDVVWTAGAADWTTFRYVVLYNDTQTSPADPLIAWWDYGSALVLGNGETFTVDFGSSIFTLA